MIDPHVVFLKTSKGETEIATREHKLNHALRYVLILVDGKSTVDEIQSKGSGLSNIQGALDLLASQEFIRTLAEAKQANNASRHDPKDEIIYLVKKMLGAHAGPVIKKFLDSDDSPEALAATVTSCKRLIKLAIDDEKAEDFVRRAQEIIFSSALQHRH